MTDYLDYSGDGATDTDTREDGWNRFRTKRMMAAGSLSVI